MAASFRCHGSQHHDRAPHAVEAVNNNVTVNNNRILYFKILI